MRAAGKLPREKTRALWFSENGLGGFGLGGFGLSEFGLGEFGLGGLSVNQIESVLLVIAAAILDFGLGDPWNWPHPVQLMGKAISVYSGPLIRRPYSPLVMKIAGVWLAILLIGGTAALSAGVLALLAQISPYLAWVAEVVLLASCFAGRSLRHAAEDVLRPLSGHLSGHLSGTDLADGSPLAQARKNLARYVGRDTVHLSAAEIRRAVLETVSENAIDGVLAPLFYAIVGTLVGMAAPIALAYKAASTLDSMVGYKEAPYTDLGWFSARFEDVLTWLPCRLSVGAIALLSGRPLRVLRICWRDARTDPSPNAGWSECAYAAALGVQLGGENQYRGKVKLKPLLGDATTPITDDIISRAMMLTRWSFLLGLVVGICAIALL